MTTEKVVLIVAVMMYLEYLYVKQNAATILANVVTGSTPNALGQAAAGAVIDIGGMLSEAL